MYEINILVKYLPEEKNDWLMFCKHGNIPSSLYRGRKLAYLYAYLCMQLFHNFTIEISQFQDLLATKENKKLP